MLMTSSLTSSVIVYKLAEVSYFYLSLYYGDINSKAIAMSKKQSEKNRVQRTSHGDILNSFSLDTAYQSKAVIAEFFYLFLGTLCWGFGGT